jgi:HSP20 family molecular chaperone IbpA
MLRSEMDRLFDLFMGGLFPSMFASSGTRGFGLTPILDVKKTDKEIVVEAELRGLDEKDISAEASSPSPASRSSAAARWSA